VQPTRAGADQFLIGSAFDDRGVDTRQRQFSGEHQPGRPAARDDHGVISFGDFGSTVVLRSCHHDRRFCDHTRVLPQAPGYPIM